MDETADGSGNTAEEDARRTDSTEEDDGPANSTEEVDGPAETAERDADTDARGDAPVSPGRFVLSMVVSVGVTLLLVGVLAYGLWSVLPSPFGLAVGAVLLGGALLGNALVVRKNYERWRS